MVKNVQRRQWIYLLVWCLSKKGKTSKRNEMPQHSIVEIEVFNMWRIDFMSLLFQLSGTDTSLFLWTKMCKWVETITSLTNDVKVVVKMFMTWFFQDLAFHEFLISNRSSHFINEVWRRYKKVFTKHERSYAQAFECQVEKSFKCWWIERGIYKSPKRLNTITI